MLNNPPIERAGLHLFEAALRSAAQIIAPLELIQKELIYGQRFGLVICLSVRRIIASRTKAATVVA